MKKILSILLGAVIVITAVLTGISAAFAENLDFTPNTPKEFNLGYYLFKTTTLTTGTNQFNMNDNWKYYYWSKFVPQYTADYNLNIKAKRKMTCEIYDADKNLIATASTPAERDSEFYYHFDTECHLTAEQTYYYKIYFSGGAFDSCGPFDITFTSGGGDMILSDSSVFLRVYNSSTSYVYDINDFNINQLIHDLKFDVVYKNGTVAHWDGSIHPFPALNGCDIIINTSDCRREVGKHTVIAHYMGYTATATFYIEGCLHEYTAGASSPPTWLEPGYTTYTCSNCGIEYKGDLTLSGETLYKNFEEKINSSSEDGSDLAIYDINNDKLINARDFALINKMYNDALKKFELCRDSSSGDENYNSVYDLNNDGIINAADYNLLIQTHSK